LAEERITLAPWRAREGSRAGEIGGRNERARTSSGGAGALPRFVLVFLSASFVAGSASASTGFGPIAWSPDGSRVLAWHRGVVSELPFVEAKAVPRTDTIPVPLALAIDWATGLLAVAPAGEPSRIDLYRRGEREPFASLGALRGEVRLLATSGSTLLAAGPGFCDSRSFPDGALLDSLRWVPGWDPVDLCITEGGKELLLRDRLICLGAETSFLPLPGPGEAIAFAGSGNAAGDRGFFRLRGDELILAPPGEPERSIVQLAPWDRLLGVALSGSTRLVLVGLGIAAEPPPRGVQPRLEVRDADSSAMVKKFRSARFRGMADREGDYEEPLSAAFDPTGHYLAVGWRIFGTQIWKIEGWDLQAAYSR
jgi:hypothetical protein